MSPKVSSLDGLFRPRSIAVVGASRRRHSIGHEVVRNLVSAGFQGPVYPVNPKADTVLSIKAWRSLDAIPDHVDLAVLVVPAVHVIGVMKACAKKKVRGVVIVSAGFREVGEEGLARENEVLKIARKANIRVVGPNCMGILNTSPEVSMNASFAAETPVPGEIGFVSQSGALGEAILSHARSTGLGLSMFASVGNRADVGAHDLLEYWEHEPRVKVILLYLESLGDAQRFKAAAERLRGKKPIIAVKSGRSLRGAKAAGSHTGSVSGEDRIVDEFLTQCGVLRADSLREMFSFAGALLHQSPPQDNRIAVVTNAGGPGILATDALAGRGLRFAELSTKTKKALTRALPAEASITNPVDLIASADAKRYRLALRPIVADEGVDAILVMFVSPIMIDAAAVAKTIAEETKDSGKPVLACIMGRVGGDEAVRILKAAGIPTFRFPEEAAHTMAGLVRYGELAKNKRGRRKTFAVDLAAAKKIIRAAKKKKQLWLQPGDVARLLSLYKIPQVESRRVSDPEAAAGVAHQIKYPVVLKADAPTLIHKSDVDAVRVGLANADEVLSAANEMHARLSEEHKGLGFIVQAMATGHRELLLGMSRDPEFGPQIVVGFGGTEVEIWRNVALRCAPLRSEDPVQMLNSLQGHVLLDGYRNQPPIDRRIVESCILRLSQMAMDLEDIIEMDLNPFIVGERAKEAAVVDARIMIRHSGNGSGN